LTRYYLDMAVLFSVAPLWLVLLIFMLLLVG
jgi:hypothetical protein